MPPRLLFLVMSSVEPVELVEQLADALSPHVVLLHHDITKQWPFHAVADNLYVIEDPVETGWGDWGFVSGVLHSVETALGKFDFDYLKLLSPTCLPLRPIGEIESAIAHSDDDVHADLFDLDADDEHFMSYVSRLYLGDKTFLHRVSERLSRIYFGRDAVRESKASLVVRRVPGGPARRVRRAMRSAALVANRALRRSVEPFTPFWCDFTPAVGSAWIGMRRSACDHFLSTARRGDLVRHFQGLRIPDELLFATVLRNSGLKVAPSLHYVSPFDDAHPRTIGPEDLAAALASGRLFARKFSTDLSDPTRRAVLERVLASPMSEAAG
jgi:hypothetical protein